MSYRYNSNLSSGYTTSTYYSTSWLLDCTVSRCVVRPVLNSSLVPGLPEVARFYKYDITQSAGERERVLDISSSRQQDINLSAAHTLYIEQVCTLLAPPLHAGLLGTCRK